MDIILYLILPFMLFGLACEIVEYAARKRSCQFCKKVFYSIMALGVFALIGATCFIEKHFGEMVAIASFIMLAMYGFWKMWLVGKATGVEDDDDADGGCEN
ncbi:hypothetical protein QET93_010955 [Akkermansia sp. N21116]|uniref:hypothetical protein n=1 Tax=Akkermansia sp. N21116 TaxID=3040764 RepID=UPI00244E7202|nr:hypothetical protein [Akkermansia sp. N21116]WPX40049.1 hypothetical protein QET93_010955 [Akkermansia sp. N21116]